MIYIYILYFIFYIIYFIFYLLYYILYILYCVFYISFIVYYISCFVFYTYISCTCPLLLYLPSKASLDDTLPTNKLSFLWYLVKIVWVPIRLRRYPTNIPTPIPADCEDMARCAVVNWLHHEYYTGWRTVTPRLFLRQHSVVFVIQIDQCWQPTHDVHSPIMLCYAMLCY